MTSRHPLAPVRALLLALVALASLDAAGQNVAASRDTLRTARQMKLALANPAPANAPETDLTLGAALDRDETGLNTWTTPIDATCKFNGDDGWVLDLISDGYTRAHKSGSAGTHDGIASPRFQASHPLFVKVIDLFGQLIAPPTDAPGWSTVSQKAGLRASADLPAAGWSLLSQVAVRHDDHIGAGVSHYWRSLHGELDYDSKSRRGQFALGATRFTQAGTPGLTEISGEWDLPLDKKTTLISQLTRGISAGAAHTAVEFDIKWVL